MHRALQMQVVDRVGGQRQFGKDDQVDVLIRFARQIEYGRALAAHPDRGGGRRGGDADQAMGVKRVEGVVLHSSG